jgi:DNA-binding NtrC family response regulator
VSADELQAPLPSLRTFVASLAHGFGELASVAASALPILILGPTGSGKEVAAAAAHELSGRRGAFVPVNCGALSPALVEAELFGHRRGAFSGAIEDRDGFVRAADRGTLFFDEAVSCAV